MMPASRDIAANSHASAWYRQPVVWLGIVIFAASLGGCIWMIVLGAQHGDTPLDTAPRTVFGVPASAHSAAATPDPNAGPPR